MGSHSELHPPEWAVRPFAGDPAWRWPPVHLLPRYRTELIELEVEVKLRQHCYEMGKRLPRAVRQRLSINTYWLWSRLMNATAERDACRAAIAGLENATCPHWRLEGHSGRLDLACVCGDPAASEAG